MSLTLALNNALTGINVSQKSLSVLANNVSNANTPGYSRQVAELSPQVLGTQGSGVRVEQIMRKIDAYLNRATQEQTTRTMEAQTVSEYLSRVQVLMGSPGGVNSLDEYIEGFFNILQSLAESPELSSFRAQAMNSGVILAREMSTLAEGIEDLRYQADRDLQAELRNVNNEILRLHDVNIAIQRASVLGESTAGLLDQRDMLLSSISGFVDVKYTLQQDGSAYVYLTSGVSLLEVQPSQFQYNGVSSLTTFTTDGKIPPITVDMLNDKGEFVGRPQEVVSSGVNKDITTRLLSGKIKGLVDIRDQRLPDMLAQLDQLAAALRDQINAIHNTGSGIPAATRLTGERAMGYDEALEWTGKVIIGAVKTDGTAPDSRYGNSSTGYLPLELDFDALRSQYGDLLTVETIMREINSHFQPQNNASVGNLQNIQIAGLSNSVPSAGNTFDFDFQLQNISGSNGNFWVTDLEILDETGVSLDNQNIAAANTVAANALGTFTTYTGSNVVTVNATGHGFTSGEMVYLNGVSGPVNGIPAAELNGRAFRITNVTANSYDIEVLTPATGAAPVDMAGVTGFVADATQIPGKDTRIGSNYSLDVSGNTGSAFYTVRANVMVEDDNGNFVTSTIEYRVDGNASDSINQRYAARSVAGGGELVVPGNQNGLVQARLVNADGNPAAPGEQGYLQIIGQPVPGQPGEHYGIVIDDHTSQEIGRPQNATPLPGSGWGFSHFFGLNNFFVTNRQSSTGDTVAGSALAMKVRDDIIANPNLISTGALTQTPGLDANGVPNYSMERTVGDNRVAQLLAKLGLQQVNFTAAGGLPSTIKSFNGYASEVLGFTAATASTAAGRATDEASLLAGFQSRADAVSGVNIDEEMANTIIFQNAYSASSQVIRTVKEMFDVLMSVF